MKKENAHQFVYALEWKGKLHFQLPAIDKFHEADQCYTNKRYA